ncbi:hypothetical protein ANN_11283 [Periplaneta americana]|uniref:Uncharacterized protein n=1 Tax=Periplaneta americana TaxID=6978 RepID=A0ABQ8T5B0_PERAM|nr:hypothetical protein ANN_11283 [Periplaneta americana]
MRRVCVPICCNAALPLLAIADKRTHLKTSGVFRLLRDESKASYEKAFVTICSKCENFSKKFEPATSSIFENLLQIVYAIRIPMQHAEIFLTVALALDHVCYVVPPIQRNRIDIAAAMLAVSSLTHTKFAKHGTTVNAAAYIQTLVKLRRVLCDKRRNINADDVKRLHDNTRPHVAISVREKINTFG